MHGVISGMELLRSTSAASWKPTTPVRLTQGWKTRMLATARTEKYLFSSRPG
jgi:hypothetical protein